MNISEITVKSALVRSNIPGVNYVVNPYLGCGHACRYCYAIFMRKYSRHNQHTPWGGFVEVKVNIAEILSTELKKKKTTDKVFLSSVCDPYQPVELRYKLTRRCLELLREFGWGVEVLTKSPLVARDMDVFKSMIDVSVGMSIGTDNEQVRKVLEPGAPPIAARIATLKRLKENGISTWAFIAPILPMNPEKLHEMLAPHVDSIMHDGLNYKKQVEKLFRSHGWERELSNAYAARIHSILGRLFGRKVEK
ncbi:MAG: radical SAM protein [Kiritimatiellae bacterium]|nr:radical SAM protein [Kiritimatiellia bacterium]MDD5519399.1 radical SAM protein [Kiritimatiellia bacterium]